MAMQWEITIQNGNLNSNAVMTHGCQKYELTMERVRERKPPAREEGRRKG